MHSEGLFHLGSCGPSLAHSRKRPASGGLAFDWLLGHNFSVLGRSYLITVMGVPAALGHVLLVWLVYGDTVTYSKCPFLISWRRLAPLSQWSDLHRAEDWPAGVSYWNATCLCDWLPIKLWAPRLSELPCLVHITGTVSSLLRELGYCIGRTFLGEEKTPEAGTWCLLGFTLGNFSLCWL